MKVLPRKAPDFSLPNQNGDVKTLADYSSKWLVLYFYPKDNTPGCTTEACSFRDERQLISELGKAEIVGISKDSVKSHKKFADKFGLNFDLLSDPEAAVIQSYGAWAQKSMFGKTYMGTLRNTYLIDPSGNIVKQYLGVDPKKHAVEIIDDLKKLQAK